MSGVMLATVSGSFFNPTSTNVLWMSINHIQMVNLLFILQIYYPSKITDYMQKFKILTLNFSFMNYDNIWFIKKMLDYFDYPLKNKALKYFDITSGSTFVNNFSFLLTLAIFIVIHVL